MKPLRELSADQLAALSDEQFVDHVITELEGGPLTAEYLALAGARSPELAALVERLTERPPPKPLPQTAKTEAPQKLDAGLPASRSYFRDRLLNSRPKVLPQPKAQPELAQGETQPQPQHRATTIDAVVAELGAVPSCGHRTSA
jgi:hypothetical protein